MKEVNTIFTQTNLIIAKQSYESCITTLKLDTATYNRLQEKYEDSKTTLDKVRQDFEAEIQVRKRFLTNILGCGMAFLRLQMYSKRWRSDIMLILPPVVHKNVALVKSCTDLNLDITVGKCVYDRSWLIEGPKVKRPSGNLTEMFLVEFPKLNSCVMFSLVTLMFCNTPDTTCVTKPGPLLLIWLNWRYSKDK